MKKAKIGRRLEEKTPFLSRTLFTKKRLLRMAMLLCAVVMTGSLLYIGGYYYYVFRDRRESRGHNEIFENALQLVTPENILITPPEEEGGPEWGEWQLERARLRRLEELGREAFAELLEINPDFRGRVSIPGAVKPLIEPLIYVHSHDNEEYLTKNFEGKHSPLGTIFLSALNDHLLMDRNIILYGHNMSSGDMFSALTQYKKAAAFRDSPIIFLEGLPENSVWVVFASYVTEPDWAFIIDPMKDNDDFGELLAEVAARSLFNTDVDVNESDTILTLMTCEHGAYEDLRFAVHARKLRPGEEMPESVTAVENPNRKPYNIPSQMRLSEIAPSRTAVMLRPGNNRLYYYQPRNGGIDWYSGNTTTVQGVYSNYSGGISQNSFLAAVYDGSERRLYLAADNVGGRAGVHLFSSYSPSGSLSSHGRVADGKNPALVHEDGVTWLLYTVAGNSGETIYRRKIKERGVSGEPELLRELSGVFGARPLGRYTVGGVPVLFWHDTAGSRVRGAWEGGETFDLSLSGDATRVTFYGTASGLRAATEKNGRISFGTVDLSALPAKPAPKVELAGDDETEGAE